MGTLIAQKTESAIQFPRQEGGKEAARGDMEASWKISIKRGKFGGGPPGQRKLSSTGLPTKVTIKETETVEGLLVAVGVSSVPLLCHLFLFW